LGPQVIAVGRLKNFNVIQLDIGEQVTANSLADNEIDCRNLKYSGSRPMPAAASAAEDDIMVVVVVVVVKVVEWFEFWRRKRAEI
jgi:hypothetical protein